MRAVQLVAVSLQRCCVRKAGVMQSDACDAGCATPQRRSTAADRLDASGAEANKELHVAEL